MSFVRRFSTGMAIAGLGLLVAFSLLAGAATADAEEVPFEQCDRFETSLTKGDGSILIAALAGNYELCGGSTNPFAVNNVFLTQLEPDGSIDRDFGDKGIRSLGLDVEQAVVALLPAGPAQSVLATDRGLIKLRADGSLDPGFGEGGRVKVTATEVFGPRTISAAAIQDDGKIVVTASDPRFIPSEFGPVIVRFKENGEPDPTFGGDGIVNSPFIGDFYFFNMRDIAVDGEGRIVIAADAADPKPVVAIRLLPDGTPDPDYGTDGTGLARTEPSDDAIPSFSGDLRLFLGGDGAVRIYGTYQCLTYCKGNILWDLDPDGIQPVGSPRIIDEYSPDKFANASGIFQETPDGGLVSTSAPGRFDQRSFNVFKQFVGGSGGFEKTFKLSPFVGEVTSVSYAGGSVLAGGSAPGTPDGDQQMAVVKLDAMTGEPDPGFGTDGVVIVPQNECPYGEAPDRTGETPLAWARCRVKPPIIERKARFAKLRTRRPSLTGTVNLTRPPEMPAFMRQQASIRLPQRLKFARNGKAKIKASAMPSTNDPFSKPGKVKVRVRGRLITVDYVPAVSYIYDNEPGPPNESLRVSFKVPRGALRPVPRKARGSKFNVAVKATYLSVDGYPTFRAGEPRWFGGNSSSTRIKVKK